MQGPERTIIHLKQNKIMEYQWGSSSPQCLIYELTKKQHKKYAELWMGTHKNGPSILQGNKTLAQYLKQKNLPDLPFLFKVLCIEKALSIQLHPNKQQAQRLFAQKPGFYPDDNEKPEMFFTLTEFQCFFGIISLEELSKLCAKQPFSLLQSKDSLSIKKMIAELCSLSIQKQRKMIDILLNHIKFLLPERQQIIEKIQTQFPYDIGILVSCLLKYKKLPPGQCFAIAAGVPHAYLRGSCLQIMKNSDNVVRLGLTPKLKDIPTLLEIMNDTIDLDGINIHQTEEGFIWNGLIITRLRGLPNEDVQIWVPFLSIGIVFQNVLVSQQFNIKAEKGSVLFFTPGQYRLKGSFKLFMGSYVTK